MKIRLGVTRWNALIEPEPERNPYPGYDGRILILNAALTYPPMPSDVQAAAWELVLVPYVDDAVKKHDACGSLRWFRAGGLNFRASIGLPPTLWEELWRRSATPPAVCEVWLVIDWSGDFGSDASDIPIREPIIHLASI